MSKIRLEVAKMSAETFNVDAVSSDTIGDVKSTIVTKEGIPLEEQQLCKDGQMLDNWRTLLECDLRDGDTVFLIRSKKKTVHMFVKMYTLLGEQFPLTVDASDLISSVKAMITERTSVPWHQQRLIFQGRELLNDEGTVSGCGLCEDSLLHMVQCLSKSIQIVVTMLSGESVTIDVETSDAISSVKSKICDAKGIACDDQRLFFQGRQLLDECILSDYDVQSKSMLRLLLPLQEKPPTDFGNSPPSATQDVVSGSCAVKGACGLHNLGNTCYLNSTLQALASTDLLRQYHDSGAFRDEISTSPLGLGGKMANAFADLVKSMWAGTVTALPPTELKSVIGQRRSDFRGYQQQDAHEVLMFLLDGLHEDVNKAPYPRPFVEQASADGRTDSELAAEAYSGNLLRNNSKIVELFQFQIRSEIAFPDVDSRSLRFEPTFCLSLPVPDGPPVSLEKCLEAFIEWEDLSREDWVRCDKTQELERSRKKLDIWNSPECLIVHLKRFRVDPFTLTSRKNDTLVMFPLHLDLTQWIQDPSAKDRAQYRLHAVVNHSGTLNFGHYTAHCRIGEVAHRQWFYFSDSFVRPASESDVVSASAYMLFYERMFEI